jgi:phenylpyruvate tautomerase PptA (4-oxalocrotonate tautomerase family)
VIPRVRRSLVPIVRIDIQSGKTTAYKRDMLRSVRSAIVESLGVDNERVTQRIIETPAENIDDAGVRSDHLTVIDVAMLPGRDAAVKSKMYAAIVEALGERPGIHQRDITVLVSDPAAECFAIGGVMQCTLPDEPEPAPAEEPTATEEPAPDEDELDVAADVFDVTHETVVDDSEGDLDETGEEPDA